MALPKPPFGKDRVARGSEGFISSALTGGSGPSNQIDEKSIGRGQKLNTASALDNVVLAMPVDSSLRESGGFGGGTDNLAHSLTGASAKQKGSEG